MGCVRWRWLPALCLVWTLSLLGTAQIADASDVAISWQAPPECPDSDELRYRIDQLLEGAVTSGLVTSVVVAREDGAYRARMRMTNRAGIAERVLAHSDCGLLTDSVAVVVALVASESTKDSPAAASTDEATLTASAVASLSLGPLPRPALGIGAAFAVEGLASLRLQLEGLYFARQTPALTDDGLAADLQLLSLGARACQVWRSGALRFGPCASLVLYHLQASGRGGEVSRSGKRMWWGPGFGLVFQWRFSSAFALHASANLTINLSRQALLFSDVGQVYQAQAVSLQLSLAPEVRF